MVFSSKKMNTEKKILPIDIVHNGVMHFGTYFGIPSQNMHPIQIRQVSGLATLDDYFFKIIMYFTLFSLKLNYNYKNIRRFIS